MPVDRRKAIVFGSAAALRLLFFFAAPGLPELLTGRVEISTVMTSFKRLQEGLFLYTHNVSPYDGGVYHQAPLFLPLFDLIPPGQFEIATKFLYVLTDILCANALMTIADSKQSGQTRLFKSNRSNLHWTTTAIGAAYLFNPLTLASCIGRSTGVFTNCAIVMAVAQTVTGSTLSAMLALSLASYLSMYPIMLLPPLLMLCYDIRYGKDKAATPPSSLLISHTSLFTASLAWLLYASYIVLSGSWDFVASTYGVQLLLPDLTPNVGLWWYFFTEMFDPFRAFFLGVFWLHLAGYTAGLCIRIYRQPLFVITTMTGLFAVFKPYPTVSDAALYLGLLPLYRHVFPLMRYSFFAASALLYATLLGPAFYHLWIYAGSGNANFFYAITLVWSLGLVLLVADSIFAVLRDEWEVERPEMKGKEVRQI